MKKIFALVLSLCMLLSAFAFAEEIPTVNWADFEPAIAEAGMEGAFYTFEEIAAQMWVPSTLLNCELTEEDVANGYIGYFATEAGTAAAAVMYVNMDSMDLATYATVLAELGATDITNGIINGIEVLTYSVPETDTTAVAMTTQAGYILEFSFSPMSDEGFASIVGLMVASIQPYVAE